MTRTTNSRIAGFTYLFYIAVAYPSMVLFNRATKGVDMAAQLASMAQHASDVRLAVVLSLLGCFSALVLAVTLYALTRDEDRDIAMFGLTCRVGEGLVGAASIPSTLGLLAMVTATGAYVPDAAAAQAIGTFALTNAVVVGASLFALGSTAFSWLLLRGRMVPRVLAWLGVVGSALLVLGLPLQLLHVLMGAAAQLMWIPVAIFEVLVAFWLMIKGAAMPVARVTA